MARFTNRRRGLRAQIVHELRSLGDTEVEVARRLEAAGVHGTPGTLGHCPVAVYLTAVVGQDAPIDAVFVGHERALVQLEGRVLLGVPLPKALRCFVAGFDHYHYPELVQRPVAERRRTHASLEGPALNGGAPKMPHGATRSLCPSSALSFDDEGLHCSSS
jgi:hypothetical protein